MLIPQSLAYAMLAGLPPEAVDDFEQAAGPFGGVDLALASHRHHDHNQPAFACEFLQASETTRLVTSAEVIGLMREKCREFVTTSPRIRTIDPQYGAHHEITKSDARVTVFPLSHGTRKYARIQNYGHLVEVGGITLSDTTATSDSTGLVQVDVQSSAYCKRISLPFKMTRR
mgnify:CR=1 FL=1